MTVLIELAWLKLRNDLWDDFIKHESKLFENFDSLLHASNINEIYFKYSAQYS